MKTERIIEKYHSSVPNIELTMMIILGYHFIHLIWLQFINAAENILEVCRDTSHSLLAPLPADMGRPMYVRGQQSIIAVIKTTGQELAGTKFVQHDVTIVPGRFFKTIKAVLTMRVIYFDIFSFWLQEIHLLQWMSFAELILN